MDTVDLPTFGAVSARAWALSAGIYMFVCGTVVSILLSDVLALLADVIGLPTEYWMVILASPAFAIGAVVWWTVVERRELYTYRLGCAFGLVTALFTGLLWTGQFIFVWSVEMAAIPIVSFIIALVVGLTAVAGLLASIPLMYVRRQLNHEVTNKTEHTP